jgi:hypothetical protein
MIDLLRHHVEYLTPSTSFHRSFEPFGTVTGR